MLPESGSSDQVRSTSHVKVAPTTAAVDNQWRLFGASLVALIVAVQGPSRWDTQVIDGGGLKRALG